MANDACGVSYFARTNFHNRQKLFGIKQADRLSHIYMDRQDRYG